MLRICAIIIIMIIIVINKLLTLSVSVEKIIKPFKTFSYLQGIPSMNKSKSQTPVAVSSYSVLIRNRSNNGQLTLGSHKSLVK